MCSVTSERPAREQIVERAMALFGAGGIESTSLREVAKAAAVSPALVVHHFGGKEGLVAAVDEAAVGRFAEAFGSDPSSPVGPAELLRLRAAQTATAMNESPEVCSYLGRALVEATPGSSRLFRLMIEGGRAEVEGLASRGALRTDADLLWVTLQHFFLVWAPLAFRAVLEAEALEAPLLSAASLERWVAANVELLERGVYR